MDGFAADRVVDDFVVGCLTRRDLAVRLMALGAAMGGVFAAVGLLVRAAEQSPPTFSAQSVDHVALSVTDVARSAEWYVRHLGLRVTSQDESSAFLGCPGGDFLALFKSPRPGLNHYSFAIRGYDQQDAARRLQAAGLTPKPRGGRMYFDDPDGIEAQVSRRKPASVHRSPSPAEGCPIGRWPEATAMLSWFHPCDFERRCASSELGVAW
jgi:catechol 2,3-dioxygenase-like lactoylglutathione lyase family enzyme